MIFETTRTPVTHQLTPTVIENKTVQLYAILARVVLLSVIIIYYFCFNILVDNVNMPFPLIYYIFSQIFFP